MHHRYNVSFIPLAGVKYHSTYVESINDVTHDTKLFTLRLPAGSHLNVPTGHHLSVKANINGMQNSNYKHMHKSTE